jgi:PAS domain S-box-containing protein
LTGAVALAVWLTDREGLLTVLLLGMAAALAQAGEQLARRAEAANQVLRDEIAQRRRAEEALRESEARFRCLVEQAADAIFVLDLDGRIVDANQRACESLGYGRGELLARSADDFEVDPTGPGNRPAGLDDSLTLEGLYRRKDGSTFPVEVRVGLFEADGRRYQLALARDVTARKRAEEELRAGREQYRLLFEANPQPMWVHDAETRRFLAVNDAAVARYGYSRREFLAMATEDVCPPEGACPGPRAEEGPVRWRHRWKDGTVREVEVTSHPLRFAGRAARLALVRDVTEQRRLEEQLRQSQKMEAVGQLAGGVAHDFNNLLTAILGHLDLARRCPPADAPPLLRAAERAAGRAAELTAKLLGFARQGQLQLGPVALGEVAQEVGALLRRTIDPRIAVEVAASERLWSVRADAGHMHQVLMNLCVNARDAMPQGGALRIEAANVTLDRRPDGRSGRFVRLSVSDTGRGMTEEVRARIFEPFFTTKGPGKGTGLGLAMVYGIVHQHGGWVECDSRPGSGARFDVFLPRLGQAAEPSPPPTTPAAPSALGGATVLLVDDEEALRGLGRAVLARQGCRVLEAEDGEKALEVYRGEPGRVDLVVLDLTMPKLSGADTLKRLVALDPRARVLLCSGYAKGQAADLACEQVAGFLPKPYRPVELLLAVAQALEGPVPRASSV